MSRVIDQPKEAETVADKWAHGNFRDIMDVTYGVTARHGENWIVRGEVEIMETLFSSRRVSFEMEIAGDGKILRITKE